MRDILDKLYDERAIALTKHGIARSLLQERIDNKEDTQKKSYSVQEWQNLLIAHALDKVQLLNGIIDVVLKEIKKP